jgi:signal transduction histidine kinase
MPQAEPTTVAGSSRSSAVPQPDVSTPRASVLLVDDQPARLLTYESILAGIGVHCVRALSGAEALEKLLKQEFAVILLDVEMPGMDGFEVARLVREHPRMERTPIIFVTGVHVSQLDQLRGYELGAIDYIAVPVVPEILRSKVALLVELHLRRKELKSLNDALHEARARLEAEHAAAIANRDAQLHAADRRKDEFLAMLAHELRNPIAPISNAAEALSRLVKDDKARALVEMIQRQGAHFSRLLDDLLDVARITQGRVQLRRETVALAASVEHAIEAIQPHIKAKSHHLTVTKTSEAVHVSADKVRLEQCVANLLINAAKYTDAGGRIRVKVAADRDQALIEVSDTGIGIAPEFLPRVFDLFAQSERSIDRSQGGLGIGLAICKQLVQMHGGTVTGASAGLGQGATFTIRLPLLKEGVSSATGFAAAATRPVRILIVDDNHDAADSLAMCLQLDGHQTRTAYSAESALQQVTGFDPQVVLLDIGLPGMDGYEVARRIRESQPSLRLIALSGYGQHDDKQRSVAAGFDAHLTKPVEMSALETLLRL